MTGGMRNQQKRTIRTNQKTSYVAQSALPEHSVVIAGSEALLKSPNVGLASWIAHYLLSHLPSLARRRSNEHAQPGLHLRVGAEGRGEGRILRIQRSYELIVSAGGVDGRPKIGIG